MRNVAPYPWARCGARRISRSRAALTAAATVVGASLSLLATEAVALQFAANSPTAKIEVRIGGLNSDQPRLTFAINTSGDLPITGVSVTLPSGLSFASNAVKLAHGVRTTGGKPHCDVRKGQLILTLKGKSPSVDLTVAGPALLESKALEATAVKLIAYNQAHPTAPRNLVIKLEVTVDSGATALKAPVSIEFR